MKTTKNQKPTELPMISHQVDALHITIPTAAPAATHELYLKGISALMRYYTLSKEKQAADADGIAAILELQQALQPDEKGLQRAYSL